ncbi:alkaline phosphatase [Anopheles darlingi]|uniref:Alkaline phosphatase n=1 Tax=Anopheles darlingi TaxID=43151 RepID=W5JTP2_ANODA|nr:alkaline phosphatase [Anopheles darlingi]
MASISLSIWLVLLALSVDVALSNVINAIPTVERQHDTDHPRSDRRAWNSVPVYDEVEEASEYWRDRAQQTLRDHLEQPRNERKAKNAIFFIGDGMSLPTVAATRMYLGNENLALSFEQFPYFGLTKTYCVNRQVADSACTATAYLSGAKINYGMINVAASVPRATCEYDHEATEIQGLLKWAQDAGKTTGIVTTTRITHATPAGAYAASAERDWEDDSEVIADCPNTPADRRPVDIASQLVHGDVGQKLKVALGCGRRHFLPTGTVDEGGSAGRRSDGVNLIEKWKELRGAKGRARYVHDKAGLLEAAEAKDQDYLLGLFGSSHCLYNLEIDDQKVEDRGPKLSEMVEAALKVLEDGNEHGYVLFVEGGLIDTAHHSNRPRLSLEETAEFHRAIDLARKRTNVNDTLIVVSSDHSHTLMYNGYPTRGNDILGIADASDIDQLPYTTLSYANGEGYYDTYENGDPNKRIDISSYDLKSYRQRYLATVPLTSETHGGEDVGVYASGPGGHLFIGNTEQNVIPVLIAYAANIGESFGWKPEPIDDDGSATRLPLPTALLSTLCLGLLIAAHIRRLLLPIGSSCRSSSCTLAIGTRLAMAIFGRYQAAYLLLLLLLSVVVCEIVHVPHGGRTRDPHSRQQKHAAAGHAKQIADEPLGFNERERDSEYWFEQAQDTLAKKLAAQPNTNHAKNVIFFIGDGLSSQTVAATRMYLGNEANSLSFEHFPDLGSVRTYCVDRQVSDSSCTATAYLSGVKINYGMVNIAASVPRYTCQYDRNASDFEGLLRWAQDAGKSTGIITTTKITHATPAGAYASSANRYWENDVEVADADCDPALVDDIAEQLVGKEMGQRFNVVLGGGRGNLLPVEVTDEEGKPGYRRDGKNLIEEWKRQHATMGKAEYVWNRQQLQAVDTRNTDYLLGLFESGHMKYNLERVGDAEQHEPTLEEMTETAIRLLEKNKNGYVLFVEGGLIDVAHHETWARLALDETAEYSKAIGTARRMTSEQDTLIVVSSDHSHTMTYNGYPKRGNDILGLGDISDEDLLPYTTLSYANGMSYYTTYTEGNRGVREDVSKYDYSKMDQLYMAMVPMDAETHGGDDVPVWASGPSSHLFRGVYEQNTLPYLISYIAQIGDYYDDSSAASTLTTLPLLALIVITVVMAITRQ